MRSNLEPRELPILFSGPMVHALLARRKRMTRRLALNPAGKPSTWTKARPRDTLWVREMWGYVGTADPGFLLYGATWREDAKRQRLENIPDRRPPMKPGIHMPRALCRLTLPLTAVRIERLNDMTDEDALAEGVTERGSGGYWVPGIEHPNKDFPYLSRTTPREMFAALWDVLHGSGAWLSNPSVVVLSFDVVEK